MNFREIIIGATLLVFAIALGVYPNLVFSFMEPSVTSLVLHLTQSVQEVASSVPFLR